MTEAQPDLLVDGGPGTTAFLIGLGGGRPARVRTGAQPGTGP